MKAHTQAKSASTYSGAVRMLKKALGADDFKEIDWVVLTQDDGRFRPLILPPRSWDSNKRWTVEFSTGISVHSAA